MPAAQATLRRALAVQESVYGSQHPQVATTLTNLGNVQWELGELPAAQATLQRALTIEETVYGPQHPHTALTLRLLAELDDLPGV